MAAPIIHSREKNLPIGLAAPIYRALRIRTEFARVACSLILSGALAGTIMRWPVACENWPGRVVDPSDRLPHLMFWRVSAQGDRKRKVDSDLPDAFGYAIRIVTSAHARRLNGGEQGDGLYSG